MNKIFCSECGQKHEYASVKPKFCSECGTSIGGVAKARKEYKEENEGDEGGDFDIEEAKALRVKIHSDRSQGISFGEMVEQKVSPEKKMSRPAPKIGIDDLKQRSTDLHRVIID